MKTKVMIVDDHPIVRQGLASLINAELNLMVVAEAKSGAQAIEMARLHHPDIITMDIGMPGMNGIEATKAILKDQETTKVIALSVHSDRKYIMEVFKAGARGFLLKDCESDELIEAVRVVQEGQPFLSRGVTNVVVQDILCCGDSPPPGSMRHLLSEREIEIFRLMAEGMSTKDIAKLVKLGLKTVETYQTRLKKKLGTSNIVDLTKLAIREGLVALQPLPSHRETPSPGDGACGT